MNRTPEDGANLKTAFKVHQRVGQVLEVLVPLHVAAVAVHYVFLKHNLLKVRPAARRPRRARPSPPTLPIQRLL